MTAFMMIETSILLTLSMKNTEQKEYDEVFKTVAKYAAFKSLIIEENDDSLAYFNREQLLYYFHQGWNTLSNNHPKKISVVTFNSLTNIAQDIYGDGVEIKIIYEGRYDVYRYMTRYIIKGEGINEKV